MKPKPYLRYKPSGVDWIGDVPETWDVKPIKCLASTNDDTLPETTAPDYEILYVDIGSVNPVKGIVTKEPFLFDDAPSRARRMVKDGDTIISTVRTYLRAIAPIANPERNLIVSTGFAVLRPHKLLPQYLSYVLRSPYVIETIVSRSVGVSYPGINASEIGSIKISIPSHNEQTKITSFLDRETGLIDKLIAKKEQLMDRLKERRTALISRAVTKGLNLNVRLKPSGVKWLGDVPVDWRVMPLKWVVSTPITDGPHETPEILDEGIPFISAEAIRSNKIDFERKRGFISEADHKIFSLKYHPQMDDIYMIKSGATTGNLAIVETNEEFNIWSPLAVVRVHKKKALPRYILMVMNSKEFQTSVQLFWTYGTQQNIGMNVIENLQIPVPPITEQQSITEYLNRETGKIDGLIDKVSQAIEKLKEYRTALISAAVTGKIDLRNEVA